ncbi:hypothetical protein [Burkholderia vietnamiensis]|nr:hypothetical protein [Burkholderia vietnamiensis]MBR8217732.1 hypothetical protein [Burkholderia vietnamiensis]
MIREAASLAANPPAARASRLPQDWVLPKAWGDWALEETARLASDHGAWSSGAWTVEHVRFEAEKFRDHWHGKSGRAAAKVDWLATWRNWVRIAGPMRGAEKKSGSAWWRSDESAFAKAMEVGVGSAHFGESKESWHARIQAAIDNGGKPPAPAQTQRQLEPIALPSDDRTGPSDASRSAMGSISSLLKTKVIGGGISA